MTRRVLITGGAGFIGSHLVRHCLARGDEVHILIRPQGTIGRVAAIAPRIAIHRIDLGDRRATDSCLADVSPHEIYHLAAVTRPAPGRGLEDVLASTHGLTCLINLVSAADALPVPPRALIRTGSLAEYGAAQAPFEEATREQPLTPYAAGLVAGSHYLEMLRPRLRFPAITARLALIYGPGQSPLFLIPALIDACLTGQTIDLERPGDRRDLLYVDDAVAGLLALGETPGLTYGVINIATGIAPSVARIARTIVQATDGSATLIRQTTKGTQSGIPDFRAVTRRADACLAWRPGISFAEGLERTVATARQPREAQVA